MLAELHWLPVEHRVKFKNVLFVFKALSGLATSYIGDLLIPYSAPRSLRSSSQNLLCIPKTRLKTNGDRAFSVVAPQLWSSLPVHFKSSPSIDCFKSNLKTFIFSQVF